jgi:hypothetical protein
VPRSPVPTLSLLSLVTACSVGSAGRTFVAADAGALDAADARAPDAAVDRGAPEVAVAPDVQAVVRDAPADVSLEPDAACSRSGVAAEIERLPVDIIWIVDNSISMAPAIDQVIRGLNDFAGLIGSRGLDYRVVMLSLRNVQRNVTVPEGRRYAVCIPAPLAGDARCGNGPRFFHSSVDVRSTQPLEQILGTLGQTMGYTAADPRGGEPWREFLRPEASKTFVVVTDDQSRLSADQFETFRGGTNPNSRTFDLPPGLLDPSWAGLFTGYSFTGIYGWGSETNPDVRCMFADGTSPSASGSVYTTLVNRRGGVRARLCDGAAAWAPFFDRIATAVERNSRIACDVAIPTPPDGSVLDPRLVNVVVRGTAETLVGKVANAAACRATGGWYYDDEAHPTRVNLCPASCERANAELRAGSAAIEVQFGCITIPG